MQGYVYILSNDDGNVLYTGCTNDLPKRLYHHKHRLIPGFTKKYNVHRLVYCEELPDMDAARQRERTIKQAGRLRREELINSINPEWRDLFDEVILRGTLAGPATDVTQGVTMLI